MPLNQENHSVRRDHSNQPLISVVVPVYFNAESLPTLYDRLNSVSLILKEALFEFVFVDDGSGDNSYQVLQKLASADSRVKVVKLSRNFGSFVACLAGLNYTTGDCATIIAADLQDPPEIIPQFFEKWKNGSKVVCAVRAARVESRLKIFLANMYYRLLTKYALKEMPKGGFDSVFIDRQVVNILTKTNEKNTSLMGLILWAGFQREYIYYTKEERIHGESKWTLSKKIKYFVDSFLGFSYFPIRIISLSGIAVAFFSFLAGLYIILQKIMIGIDVKGFPTLVVIVLFTSGIQMIMLGVVGEYLWRNLEETRKRPVFIVDSTLGFSTTPNDRNLSGSNQNKVQEHIS